MTGRGFLSVASMRGIVHPFARFLAFHIDSRSVSLCHQVQTSVWKYEIGFDGSLRAGDPRAAGTKECIGICPYRTYAIAHRIGLGGEPFFAMARRGMHMEALPTSGHRNLNCDIVEAGALREIRPTIGACGGSTAIPPQPDGGTPRRSSDAVRALSLVS
jgi:hypothetical protein